MPLSNEQGRQETLTWLLLDLSIECDCRELLRSLSWWAEVNLQQVLGNIEACQATCRHILMSEEA